LGDGFVVREKLVLNEDDLAAVDAGLESFDDVLFSDGMQIHKAGVFEEIE
jgi:hypothetical protein